MPRAGRGQPEVPLHRSLQPVLQKGRPPRHRFSTVCRLAHANLELGGTPAPGGPQEGRGRASLLHYRQGCGKQGATRWGVYIRGLGLLRQGLLYRDKRLNKLASMAAKIITQAEQHSAAKAPKATQPPKNKQAPAVFSPVQAQPIMNAALHCMSPTSWRLLPQPAAPASNFSAAPSPPLPPAAAAGPTPAPAPGRCASVSAAFSPRTHSAYCAWEEGAMRSMPRSAVSTTKYCPSFQGPAGMITLQAIV